MAFISTVSPFHSPLPITSPWYHSKITMKGNGLDADSRIVKRPNRARAVRVAIRMIWLGRGSGF